MPDFASRLKQLRINHKHTQKELAEFLDVSQNAIFNWENGKREPSYDTIKKIAVLYDVSIDYLMGYDPNELLDYVLKVIAKGVHLTTKDTEKAADSSTIAAHFDGSEYTEEEMEEIKKFAEFVKSKRKDQK